MSEKNKNHGQCERTVDKAKSEKQNQSHNSVREGMGPNTMRRPR